MPVSVTKEAVRVVLLTPWSRIEGLHHLVPGVRVSDSVNSDNAVRTRYLPLTEAVVSDLRTDAVLFRSQFLMVSHAHIVCMAPASEVDAAPATRGGDAADRAAALSSDMETLLRGT